MTSPTRNGAAFTARTLRSGFLRWAEEQPERPALVVGDGTWSYGRLAHEARVWASCILTRLGRRPARVGVFAYRSEPSYIGTLAALIGGAAYVPLNRTFPVERTREMLRQAEVDAIIADRSSSSQLAAVLDGLQRKPLVLLPEESAPVRELDCPVVDAKRIREQVPHDRLPAVSSDDLAYLLFTSGSTGRPKGVGVTHANAIHFIDSCMRRYGFQPDDRFSQTFDQTFDLSVFDLFVAWECGASVHTLQSIELLAPQVYVQKHHISVWFSVPSIPILMRRKNLLRPDAMPSLRWSLFCGEPLSKDIAMSWRAVAPNAILENLYGPTELTVACLAYRWNDERSPAECVNGIVPIGRPFDGLAAVIVDESKNPVAAGDSGELCVCGPQVVPGYWRDPGKTRASFVFMRDPEGHEARYYRTGDRVERLPTGDYAYLGRMDHQIKVSGHRVELGEIEAVMRRDPRVAQAVALGWPIDSGIAQGIVAFVSGDGVDSIELVRCVRKHLPEYMVPREIVLVDEFPLNVNGKIDRQALAQRLASRRRPTESPMEYVLTDEVDPGDEVFLILEAEASGPYTRFVFTDEVEMRGVRDFLLKNHLCEFAPPFARIIVVQGRTVGMMACLAYQDLIAMRLKAAWSLKREGVLEANKNLENALHLASQALARPLEGDYYLSRIAIASSSRGRGLARILMQRFEAEARALRCRRLLLEVEAANAAALRLYRAAGFQEFDQAHVADAQRGRVLDYRHLAKLL